MMLYGHSEGCAECGCEFWAYDDYTETCPTCLREGDDEATAYLPPSVRLARQVLLSEEYAQ